MHICSAFLLSFMYSLDMHRLRNSVTTFAVPVDEIRSRVSLPRIALHVRAHPQGGRDPLL